MTVIQRPPPAAAYNFCMSISRLSLLVVAALTLSTSLFAQEAVPKRVSEEARNSWEMVRDYVLRSAETMPEENYSFKPVPEVFSFGEMIGHITDAQNAICSLASGATAPTLQVKKTVTKKVELIQALTLSDKICDEAHAAVTGARAAETVKAGRSELPRFSVLIANNNHTIEHYGNLVTYLRMKGLVPPSSEPRRK